jgi:hypothetical protein
MSDPTVLYEIESVVHCRVKTDECMVKWAGYPDSENTWEPREQLPADVLAKFIYQPAMNELVQVAARNDMRPAASEGKAAAKVLAFIAGTAPGRALAGLVLFWVTAFMVSSIWSLLRSCHQLKSMSHRRFVTASHASTPERKKKAEFASCPNSPVGNDCKCTICLSGAGPPFPVQSGCACRGAGGLAHIKCRVSASIHLAPNNRKVWSECGT